MSEKENVGIKRAMMLPELLELRNRLLARSRTPETVVAMEALVDSAWSLEMRMRNWEHELPAGWKPRSVAYVRGLPEDVELAEAWTGPVHTYLNIYVAGVINRTRSARNICSSLIANCLMWINPVGYEYDMRFKHAAYIEQQMLDEICWSIPFHLGWPLDKKKGSESDVDHSKCNVPQV